MAARLDLGRYEYDSLEWLTGKQCENYQVPTSGNQKSVITTLKKLMQ
ncbi:MAG: hypothetical protein HON68_11305 [Gammaproteobacteria bacterium]|nr:hypothetical protein [Gammaproteobacteria bacterium]MBT4789704.1 hypothetical protein [Gammaproteobacteria bacterium]MBT5372390.1 hypothetical protein [Gammaproteobacteria bacterium]HIJ23989.1 hypothetical protein [Gammaproteobacteria bacterium]HIJ25858.1 hypothetical protein [Gammaproteobacteria bacterium]